ncbi:hypothetical protein GCM10028792_18660 [Salinisphaera aquimarina]
MSENLQFIALKQMHAPFGSQRSGLDKKNRGVFAEKFMVTHNMVTHNVERRPTERPAGPRDAYRAGMSIACEHNQITINVIPNIRLLGALVKFEVQIRKNTDLHAGPCAMST